MLGLVEGRGQRCGGAGGCRWDGGWGSSLGFSILWVTKGGLWKSRGDTGEVRTYQTPLHQVLGLNHNTANYLLLTRKNERGLHMEKIGLSGGGDTLIA